MPILLMGGIICGKTGIHSILYYSGLEADIGLKFCMLFLNIAALKIGYIRMRYSWAA